MRLSYHSETGPVPFLYSIPQTSNDPCDVAEPTQEEEASKIRPRP